MTSPMCCQSLDRHVTQKPTTGYATDTKSLDPLTPNRVLIHITTKTVGESPVYLTVFYSTIINTVDVEWLFCISP